MSAERCAVCGGEDLFASGICSACADEGGRRQLLFLRPSGSAPPAALSSRLRAWTGSRAPGSLEDVARGWQPIARLSEATTSAAARQLSAQGIQVRVFPEAEWYRALPAGYVAMVAGVLAIGGVASLQSIPVLAVGSPLAAVLLLWAASLQLRKPLIGGARSKALLPSRARTALAHSVGLMPDGRVRALVLDIARAGEATYASLPDSFRSSGLGESVVSLVTEAGALGLETERLQVIEQARGRSSARGGEIHRSSEERVRLLEQTLDVLGRIAQHGADSDEAAAAEVTKLLGEVRAEAAHRVEAETEVEALLKR